MSRNGVGTCWLTTRIISSGVTPLAASDGDERAGAGADVDVELVDGAVDRQQVERAQGADLVDAAGEAAAAEHERGLRPPRPTPARAALRRGAAAAPLGSSLTTLPIRGVYGPRLPRPRGCFGPAMRIRLLVLTALACLLALAPGAAAASLPALQAKLGREMRLAGTSRAPTSATSTPADALRPQARRRARARVGREALHDVDRAAALRPRRHAARPSRSPPRRSTRAACCAATSSSCGGGDPTLDRARDPRSLARASCGRAGIARITGSVLGDESLFDALRGGPTHRRRLRPRPRRRARRADGRPRLLRRARRPARSPRRARWCARCAPTACSVAARTRRRHARPTARAGRCATRSPRDARADRAHERAVGQLLRRDAAQGPRRALRRGRHDRARARPSCARAGRVRGPPADGRRLRAVARRPHERRARSCGCSTRCTASATARRSRPRCRSPGASGTLRAPHARHRRRGRCRAKTGTLSASARWRATA